MSLTVISGKYGPLSARLCTGPVTGVELLNKVFSPRREMNTLMTSS
jgi:hypothetical protein